MDQQNPTFVSLFIKRLYKKLPVQRIKSRKIHLPVDPKDGRCSKCNGIVEIVASNDVTMTVNCKDCSLIYQVKHDAFGGVYYANFMAKKIPELALLKAALEWDGTEPLKASDQLKEIIAQIAGFWEEARLFGTFVQILRTVRRLQDEANGHEEN